MNKPRTTVVASLWVEQGGGFHPLLFERSTITIKVEDERGGIELLRQMRAYIEQVQAERAPSANEVDGDAPLLAKQEK